jgi:hypothetical protein
MEDEDVVFLMKNGTMVNVFTKYATIQAIQDAADRCLGGDAVKDLVSCDGIEFK